MKKIFIKRVVGASVAMPLVPYLFWCGGFDFNIRGETAVFCSVITLFAMAMGAFIAHPPEGF